ncbi:hypothetical protein [uncultured Methanoregula sp.]|uniref:hypothetical protein n=1 Tax=uncultured Methanoregula sp. TaxID=1005933 RepID=UPI002AAAA5C8|nr:hypothetical protein [uncultured Methanoregula sp.]
MSKNPSKIPYHTLVAAVDELLESCEEDTACLSRKLDALSIEMRSEILVSDLLNACQTFFYFFRLMPGDLARERLDLEPASSLVQGLKIEEYELLELYFLVRENTPIMVVSDGEKALATFSGRNAYADGMQYIRNPEYNS